MPDDHKGRLKSDSALTYYGTRGLGNRRDGIYFHALLDAKTREPILKLDLQRIVPVPGQAVYIRTTEQLIRRDADPEYWKERRFVYKVDVHTGKLSKTDVTAVYTLGSGWMFEPGCNIPSDPMRYAAVVERRTSWDGYEWVPFEGTITVVPPVDSNLPAKTMTGMRYTSQHSSSVAGELLKFHHVDDGQSVTTLFNLQGALWLTTTRRVVIFEQDDPEGMFVATNPVKYLASPVPGTTEEDDLWEFFGTNGEFGTPDGVIGYRPIGKDWKANQLVVCDFDHFLARRDDAEPGRPWLMVDAELNPIDDAEYLDVELVTVRSFQKRGVDRFDWFERSLLLHEVAPQKWIIADINAIPSATSPHPSAMRFASADEALADFDQQQVKVETMHRQWMEEKRAEQERQRREQLDRSFRHALANAQWNSATNLASQRGGDSFYELVTALPRPGVWIIDKALANTTDAGQRAELKQIRVAAVKHAAALEAQAQAERARQAAARASAARAMSSWNSSTNSAAVYPRDNRNWFETHTSPGSAKRYYEASTFSLYKKNMGWQKPYGWH